MITQKLDSVGSIWGNAKRVAPYRMRWKTLSESLCCSLREKANKIHMFFLACFYAFRFSFWFITKLKSRPAGTFVVAIEPTISYCNCADVLSNRMTLGAHTHSVAKTKKNDHVIRAKCTTLPLRICINFHWKLVAGSIKIHAWVLYIYRESYEACFICVGTNYKRL